MFHRNPILNFVLATALIVAFGTGCAGTGCGGCSSVPLPEGGLPANQTVEGGAQVRITDQGFETISGLIAALIEDQFGAFCIPRENFSPVPLTFVGMCDQNSCAGNAPGCGINLTFDQVNLTVDQPGELTVEVQMDLTGAIDAKASIPSVVNESCTLDIDLQNMYVSANIGVDVDPGTGELRILYKGLNAVDLSQAQFSGCGNLGTILSAVPSFLDSILNALASDIAQLLNPIIAPVMEAIIEAVLPDPLGIEASYDIGALLSSFSPSTRGFLETRMVPGGYAYLERNGLSLGVITGLNADIDTSTRDDEHDNEPALCVPPLTAPNLGAAPHNLDTISRDNGDQYSLLPANIFRGLPDGTQDLTMGASETLLDLAGHHLVTSGALCLNISTEQIGQLNLGTIGLLVPSFAELGSSGGKDPLLLVTRPLTAIDFSIGEGTASDPSLTLTLDHFEIDFYAFIFERWVRGFTIALDTNVGINLEFTTDADGNPALLPVLSGLSANNITVTVDNAEFLRESAAELEVVFPAILDLALPQITGALGAFTLPSISGFGLTGLTLSKVTTDEDDFLAIDANLGATSQMLQAFASLIELHPALGARLESMKIKAPDKVETQATLTGVRTPSPEAIIAGLAGDENGALPMVFIDAPEFDGKGRRLEYTYNINSGLYRPFVSTTPLVISDGAFAIQGRHLLNVRARAVGDYASLDDVGVTLEAVIDSVPPVIDGPRTEWVQGDLKLYASDLVSDRVQFSLSTVDAQAPALNWTDGVISEADVWNVVAFSGQVRVWARDDTGNVSTLDLELAMPTKRVDSGGCAVSDGNGDWASGILAGLVLILLVGGRRFKVPLKALRSASAAVMLVGAAFIPGCDCSGSTADSCVTDADCASQCGPNTLPLCTEFGECLCADDIPFGRVGQYSEMALDPVAGGAWVSAYNSTHGDLMVAKWDGTGRIAKEAWVFLDGVPDGPVVVPDSENRDGIFAPGDDVGLYTDIAVTDAGTVFISYHDASHGSLKFASFADGAWQIHTIADGNRPSDPELGYDLAGQYSSVTTDAAGRPGVAFYRQSKSGGDITTELVYARGHNARPQSATDWTLTVVDSAVVSLVTSEILPVPEGVGLFVNSARLSNEEPVLVYYDRVNGDLKMAVSVDAEFGDPTVVDGGEGIDVGWYPSLAIDDSDIIHIAYVDVINNDILYINSSTMTRELVDDGYRLVGTTPDGLPKPEFHFVGDDSSIVFSAGNLVIGYQDATWHELLIARKDYDTGLWNHVAVAGDEDPFTGGYGFYASAQAASDQDVVMSTWVLDQPNYDAWVEIFRLPLGPEG